MSAATKTAETGTAVHELIRKRWSARSFSDKAISREEMDTLLEAAIWAPSSINEQPWRFIYAFKGEKAFDQLVSCLAPFNQTWAKNAGALVLVLAKKHFEREGNPENRHALHDAGAAVAMLLIQATSMDIYGHIMGGVDLQKTKAEFHIPDTLEIGSVVALGYLDSPDKLEEPLKSRELAPRTRKGIKEISFHGRLPEL